MSSWTELEYIPDYAARALDDLLGRYRGKSRVEALFGGLADGVQTLEDLAFDVLVSTTLENASGDALDQWGALVGVQRAGFGDPTYRRFIRGGVQVNISGGRVDEMVRLYRTLCGPCEVRHDSHYPAGFRLTCYRAQWMTAKRVRRVKRMMGRAKPAGRDMGLAEAITERATAGGYSQARDLENVS